VTTTMTLEGIGLRSGHKASVVLARSPGPFLLGAAGREAPLSLAKVVETTRATTLDVAGETIATVEHLLSACAGLGVHEGLVVTVVGGEVPLLDGASLAFVRALESLGVTRTPAPWVVVREATLTHGESRYTFVPGDGSRVEATLSFDDDRIDPVASWDGSVFDYVSRIATARTFAFEHELSGLIAAGHASHVAPESVVVLSHDRILASGRRFERDEPARHKLLDLIGDLFLYGGPPRGFVHAFRPGHSATHAVMRDAVARGVVA
jgi:UDP-3-O-[3-hydroxymyristoyl] N-acetylglucosamine deacetylase